MLAFGVCAVDDASNLAAALCTFETPRRITASFTECAGVQKFFGIFQLQPR